jgi:2-oxoglutarate ferredoxin oxidoreductase subunit alpha
MQRLEKKWDTAKEIVPKPYFYQEKNMSPLGVIFFGTSTYSSEEAIDLLREQDVVLDAMQLKAFPFNKDVEQFIEDHEIVFVIEQNRDAQMRSLLINELEINPKKLIRVLNYDGMPITADKIVKEISKNLVTN